MTVVIIVISVLLLAVLYSVLDCEFLYKYCTVEVRAGGRFGRHLHGTLRSVVKRHAGCDYRLHNAPLSTKVLLHGVPLSTQVL